MEYFDYQVKPMQKTSSSLHFSKPRIGFAGKESETHWVPNTDVYVTDAGLVIRVELAGMRREDLELSIEGNKIKISGHRPDGCRSGRCRFLVMEINYGIFQSVIELPAGYNVAMARAAYQNGFLRIDIPHQSTKSTPIVVTSPEERPRNR
jgi:HSP20 family protein